MKRALGVCYYPEHWPEKLWAEDAARMVEAGLSWVRIGEFAWSVLEPRPGEINTAWLDRAIDVLGSAGLKVILGTPTATPPRWMATKHPDMFALDEYGRTRGFGSRRHYCFSHPGYLQECRRITELLARRFGENPHVAAWQTDNEYGCHDTTLSYSDAARRAFRDWLARTYQSPEALNRAWGNIFWSMNYEEFEEVDLPNLTVTEPNPSHALAFRRFSSDQVLSFNRAQVDILRRHTSAPILHNYMGRITEFDHFKMGEDLDIATWDSYPLGFLEDRLGDGSDHKRAYARQGDPDFQAFHHDLYRRVGNGRWWIIEQQPGPVNWAPVNPAPLPGMVRLWSWEAFAHGAETVCYFRWRQVPFAQEQMHAGLRRVDDAETQGLTEAKQVAAELSQMPETAPASAPVALVFDYASAWSAEVQPQGSGFSYFRLVFEAYRALRKLGLNIDILSPDCTDFSAYKLLLAPGLTTMPDSFASALERFDGHALLGPRFNDKTAELTIPVPLPPAIPGIDTTVARVETFRADQPRRLEHAGAAIHWMEELEGTAPVLRRAGDGAPVHVGTERLSYLGIWPDPEAWQEILTDLCNSAGIEVVDLPDGLRRRATQTHMIYFNYAAHGSAIGDLTVEPADIAFVPLS
ncbi:MAG: beta-galactosidase [Pseudomonadota bacterium]